MTDHAANRGKRQIDPQRLAALRARELARYESQNQGSRRAWMEASAHLVGGVGSSYQLVSPFPLLLERGAGSLVIDADGHARIDLHNAFGSMVQGHAHPAVTKAVARRAAEGTHFSAPNRDAGVVADHLAERFGLPWWRFSNSGSEATMDAIRIARGATGRDTVVKITGSYHGHHDTVMVDTAHLRAEQTDGDQAKRPGVAYGAGIPDATVALTVSVPFNDLAALEARFDALEAEGRPAACLIMEAAMMNCGVILPAPGYLAGVREATRKRGIVWIVDEVKTGLTIAAGGACEYFGIAPDMVTLAKALGAGLPTGAIGATTTMMSEVESGRVRHVGTFSGNPLAMAAARASLEEVLTPDAYRHLEGLNAKLLEGTTRAMARYGLPGHAVGIRSKGVAFLGASEPITDFRSWAEGLDPLLVETAWLFETNRGIYTTPGRDEEWTLAVSLSDEQANRYLAVFDELCAALGD